MSIAIDPEIITQMSQLCESSKAALDEAVKISKKVIEHDDWNCKERDFINDSIIELNTEISYIQENFTEVSVLFINAASRLVEIRNKLAGIIDTFDNAISTVFSHGTISTFASDVTAIATDIGMADFSNTIQNVSFADFEKVLSANSVNGG